MNQQKGLKEPEQRVDEDTSAHDNDCYLTLLTLITFLNPTVVEFHHPLFDHFSYKLSYDQNFKIV